MADNKKYYYLKLKENFFDSEEMIILENMQDGYLYSNILLKLYLRSLKSEGRLMYKDIIPYTPQVLASIVRHPVGVVEKALDIFQRLGLIDRLDSGAIYMMDIQNFIGQSSTEADRIRDYRRRIEAEKKTIELEAPEDNVTNVRTNVMTNDEQMNVQKYTIIRDRDRDRDRDKSISCSPDVEPRTHEGPSPGDVKQDKPAQPSKRAVDEHFEELWSLYPSKRGKNQISDKTKRSLMGVRIEDMKRAIDRYVAEKESAPYDRQWLNGSTWFNGRYLDYINDDYTPPPDARKPKGKGYRYKSAEGPRDFSDLEE